MKNIGKYKILSRIAEGGMGVVYKGFDPLLQREVAIKVVSEKPFNTPEIKERFIAPVCFSFIICVFELTIRYFFGISILMNQDVFRNT